MIPGSVPFLIVGLAAGAVLLFWPATRRWARRWLVALAVAYWLLASIPVASLLAWGLAFNYRPIESPADLHGATAIVLLGGGNTLVSGRTSRLYLPSAWSANRVLEAARLYHLMGDPLVISSGGITIHRNGESEAAGMKDLLIRFGVPADRIILEERSHNTREEALYVPPMLRAHGIDRFALVTSPIHMRRALGAFRATGAHPIPAVATQRFSIHNEWWVMVPTGQGLELGEAVAHEYLGWVYYLARGWLRPWEGVRDQ